MEGKRVEKKMTDDPPPIANFFLPSFPPNIYVLYFSNLFKKDK